MRASASCLASLGLIFTTACGADRKDRAVTRTCQCFQADGGVSTASYPGFIVCDSTVEEALARCQDLPITGCARIGSCTCTWQDLTQSYCD